MSTSSKLTRIIVTNTAELENVLKTQITNVKDQGQQLFLLFTGEKDSVTNKSWCGDCVDAQPILDTVFQEGAATSSNGIVLIECPLVRNDYKGNPSHPYRVHPQIKLQKIPTLMRWGNKGKTGECVEDECKDVGLVKELVLN